MKELSIPEGYELDLEKSEKGKIVLKAKCGLPKSIEEVDDRQWYIDSFGNVQHGDEGILTRNHVSTTARAEAWITFMQLVELRDAWNGDWEADWNDNNFKYVIYFSGVDWRKKTTQYWPDVFHFRTAELRDKFLETFEDELNLIIPIFKNERI